MCLFRSILIGLVALIFSAGLGLAGQPIVFDVIPTQTGAKGSDPFTFKEKDFTTLHSATPYGSCFTCFTTALHPSEKPDRVKKATFDFAFFDASCPAGNAGAPDCQGSVEVRFVSYYFAEDEQRIWDRTWPTVKKKPHTNPSFISVDVTDQWNAYMQGMPFVPKLIGILPEVKGTGSMYLARIYLEF